METYSFEIWEEEIAARCDLTTESSRFMFMDHPSGVRLTFGPDGYLNLQTYCCKDFHRALTLDGPPTMLVCCGCGKYVGEIHYASEQIGIHWTVLGSEGSFRKLCGWFSEKMDLLAAELATRETIEIIEEHHGGVIFPTNKRISF